MQIPTPAESSDASARTMEALWGVSPAQRRGPKPRLSREQIIAAAVQVADVEGLAALSMQRVADELGCAKMALYRHVPGKSELTALMLDAVVASPPVLGEPSQQWRPRMRTWATSLFAVFGRHPWMLEVSVGVRVLGPNELTWLESGVSVLAHTGLSGPERLDAVVLILGHVRSLAQQSAGTPASDVGMEHDLAAVMSRILADHSDDYPQVRAALDPSAEPGGRDDALTFGLDRILDGLAVLIDSRE